MQKKVKGVKTQNEKAIGNASKRLKILCILMGLLFFALYFKKQQDDGRVTFDIGGQQRKSLV